jgi:GABA permease
VIAASNLVFRKKREKAGEVLSYRMWLFPGLTWVTILFIVTVLIIMLCDPKHQSELLATGGLTLVIIATSLVLRRKKEVRQRTKYFTQRSSDPS